ncbi:tetratricopeptide repeat protein [Haloactinospora alba]|nr:tetratricopeptide repeat protein [Haloactinospora alba]
MHIPHNHSPEQSPEPEVEQLYTAANAGGTDAMVSLGLLLGEQDRPTEAEHWWQAAARGGDPAAACNLGNLLHTRGRPKEAEHWLQLAADQGYA